MSYQALAVVECLFTTIWQLFTSWHIPGTSVTPAAAFIFFIVVGISLRFMTRIIGNGIDIQGGIAAERKFQTRFNRDRLK